MFSNLTPMVKRILILNVGIFLLEGIYPNDAIRQWFSLYNPVIPGNEILMNPNFKVWQILSYMFLHANMMHIFSNMFAVLIFGPAIEAYMGSKRFLYYYLICGVGAALFNMGIDYIEWSLGSHSLQEQQFLAIKSMLGASGAVFGILAAFAMLFPNVEMMLLFLPIPIKAKYFVAIYAIFELVQGFSGAQTGVAHWAHIGGLITGLILLTIFGFRNRNYS